MSMLESVPSSSFRQQTWANGSGQTTELAAGPQRDAWQWRISMARVDTDGAFSVLPGVRRQLAPLDGSLELHFDDDTTRIVRRLEVVHFDGARGIDCHLPDGAGRDFNLMLRDGADGTLMLRPLLGSMVLLPQPGSRWFIYVVAGACHLGAGTEQLDLDMGDAAWVQPSVSTRALIEGGGEIALVRLLTPAPDAGTPV
ncbi:MAG TPA: HutD family protein [Rhodanobacteraceae bacterium]